MADSCPNCNSPDGIKIVRNIVVKGIAKTLWTSSATLDQVHQFRDYMCDKNICGYTEFEQDLLNDPDLLNLVMDESFAKNLYASLCNNKWVKDDQVFSASFRYAGGLVALLRNTNGSLCEDYMDFYCSGFEGTIFPEVLEVLTRLGWSPQPYED